MATDLSPLRTYLKEQIRVFGGLLNLAHNHPTPEAVHQLRVATRRISTSLWLLKTNSELPSFRHQILSLRELGQYLGKLREVDVALGDSRTFHLDPSALRAKRRRARAELKAYLTLDRRHSLLRDLRRASLIVDQDREVSLEKPLKKLLKRTKSWAKSPPHNAKGLHRLRIDLKKVRYALEAQALPIAPLQKLQDILGRAHDLRVLQNHYGKHNAVHREENRLQKKVRQVARPALRTAQKELRFALRGQD